MAGLSIFYTYEPACSFLLHLSLSPVPVFSFHRLGSRAWQRVMKADSMRAALGKEGGREKKWVSSLPRGEDEQVQESELFYERDDLGIVITCFMNEKKRYWWL